MHEVVPLAPVETAHRVERQRQRGTLTTALAGAIVLLSACGRGPNEPGPNETAPGQTATATTRDGPTTTVTSSVGPTSPPSPTGPTESPEQTPPAGIFASIPFTRTPIMIELGTQSASSPTTEITGTVTFEFVGFDTDDDSITVTVTDPNGDTMAAQLDGAIWEATALPGFPPGPYAFSARQTSAQGASEAPEATGSFSVVPATKPRAVALDPFLRPGSTFHIALAGFPSDAGFFLYGPKDDQNLQLLRPLAPPSLSDGAAIYPVPTEPDDQPGLYGVWSAPCGAVHACATFSVSA